jgi:radical SAM superfamily enzyme YgiQ (UPF0313 family)
MNKVLLTHSYFLHLDKKQLDNGKPYPPLATLYAAAVLRNEKIPITFYDVQFDSSEQAAIEQIVKCDATYFVVYEDGFNYLTKMCLSNMRDAAFEMIKAAKRKGMTVIFSGSDATDHSQQYLETGVDYIIVGEAEKTLIELIRELNKKEGELTHVQGLRYLSKGKLTETAKRVNIQELDILPLPAWDMLNATPYIEMWNKSTGFFSMNMVTTRGCPFKCNWCAKPIYGNRYNSRSPEQVVEEIVLLQSKFPVKHLWFADDIFGLKPGWVKQFAKLISDKNIQIKFKIQSRVDLLLEEETIKYLSQAGCNEIWVGAESGSQKILDAMDKGTKVEQIAEATRQMKRFGIKPCFFLQFGYSGEDKEDIAKTISMVKQLMPHDLGISVSYPLPGTKFYEKVKEEMHSKTNWTDSDDLAILFHSKFHPDFYKKLQRYVHYYFRFHKQLSLGVSFSILPAFLKMLLYRLKLKRYAF